MRVVGDQQHGDRGEDQDRALDEQRRPVHRHRAHRRPTCPALPCAKIVEDAAITQVQTNAATSAPNVTSRWTARRSSRGTNASTSTPTTAAPKTTSIGASWLYSMLGAAIAPGDGSSDSGGGEAHGWVPFWATAGWAGTGSCAPTWDIVALTAGLITSSTGLG